ncbi:nucleotidyltransferase family protein [Desulfosporosinus burensis]
MDISKFIIVETMPIIETMEAINNNGHGVAFICDNGCLLGVVTDGDIRRHILKNGDLKRPVGEIANYNPKYGTIGDSIDIAKYMREQAIATLPMVNKDKIILSIHFVNSNPVHKNTNLKIPVVIMAGGKGTRLYPYTQILPKPLIPIGEKTITELIMDHFEEFGCDQFNMIVNYKKNLIKAFFQDSEQKRFVEFTDEIEFMGTGGGLKLLTGKYNSTFFMSNCDVIVQDDYSEILKHHKKQKNLITIVCAIKNVIFPYGTIEVTETGQASQLKEKPNFSLMTNTGFYVIEPELLDRIPPDTFIHITDVIQNCIDVGERVGVYPVCESAWLDMGNMEELERMKERLS